MADHSYRYVVEGIVHLTKYHEISHKSGQIKDIKHWILSKCNAWGTSGVPQPPRFRPASPVTFAVPSRRSSMDSGSFGGTDDGEDDDWDAFAYDYNRDVRASDSGASASLDRSPITRTSTHDLPAMPASTSSLNALSGTSLSEAALLSKYTLVSFSCGYILEDEGSLSWYNLRPFEMLELHRVCSIVPLPRGEISYIEPYFESPVQVSERPYPRRSRRPQKQTRSMEEQQHTVEWKPRWAVIREGVLNLCKDSIVRLFICLRIHACSHISSLLRHTGSRSVRCLRYEGQMI